MSWALLLDVEVIVSVVVVAVNICVAIAATLMHERPAELPCCQLPPMEEVICPPAVIWREGRGYVIVSGKGLVRRFGSSVQVHLEE